MQLSSKGRYAVMAMADLARHSLSTDCQALSSEVQALCSEVQAGNSKVQAVAGGDNEAVAVRISPVPIAAVSERQHISQTFLEQIFMQLRRGGLVTSSRGPGGGYVLARKPDEISIFEVMQAVDEPVQMTRCSLDDVGGCVAGDRCLTHGLWQDLSEHIIEFLRRTSLADVIAGPISQFTFEASSGGEVRP
ncbi:MAG: HTH-type transcriptional regulator IscR [Rhodomicrobium sp.]|nr:MAG: HTH-type transcriptional regulator IscR [Rhodomicrobium sp.]